jgi:hypothetical protein
LLLAAAPSGPGPHVASPSACGLVCAQLPGTQQAKRVVLILHLFLELQTVGTSPWHPPTPLHALPGCSQGCACAIIQTGPAMQQTSCMHTRQHKLSYRCSIPIAGQQPAVLPQLQHRVAFACLVTHRDHNMLQVCPMQHTHQRENAASADFACGFVQR